jgi:hypothetical protein
MTVNLDKSAKSTNPDDFEPFLGRNGHFICSLEEAQIDALTEAQRAIYYATDANNLDFGQGVIAQLMLNHNIPKFDHEARLAKALASVKAGE